MNTTDKVILLRVPDSWLQHQREQLAKHPLYENLSDYLRALADCGEAALNAPHACITCTHLHEDMNSDSCYPCMQMGEDHWECEYLRKEAPHEK